MKGSLLDNFTWQETSCQHSTRCFSPPQGNLFVETLARKVSYEARSCQEVSFTISCLQEQLRNLYIHTHLSDGDVLELGREGEDPKQFYLAEGGLQQLVVGGHGLIGDVVVTGNATKICYLAKGSSKGSSSTTIPKKLGESHQVPAQALPTYEHYNRQSL